MGIGPNQMANSSVKPVCVKQTDTYCITRPACCTKAYWSKHLAVD